MRGARRHAAGSQVFLARRWVAVGSADVGLRGGVIVALPLRLKGMPCLLRIGCRVLRMRTLTRTLSAETLVEFVEAGAAGTAGAARGRAAAKVYRRLAAVLCVGLWYSGPDAALRSIRDFVLRGARVQDAQTSDGLSVWRQQSALRGLRVCVVPGGRARRPARGVGRCAAAGSEAGALRLRQVGLHRRRPSPGLYAPGQRAVS